jgi:hypothetical protein
VSAQKGEVDHDVLAALAWKLVPVEVPPHVEEILGPYPELLEQWKAQMALPCMQEPGWSGTLKRYLDPVYMRGVAFEHGRLIEGNIERPEPELSTAIEAALQLHAGMRQKRAEHLSDPWWRAMSYDWNGIAEYHDPDYLNRFVLPPGSWRTSLRPRPVGRRSGSRSRSGSACERCCAVGGGCRSRSTRAAR